MNKDDDVITNLLNELTLDDLTESQNLIANLIGMPLFIEMSRKLGGCSFYIPRVDVITYPLKKEHILNEYDGFNRVYLAKKYNISESSVNNIIKSSLKKRN